VRELKKYGELFNVKVCVSTQRREIDGVLGLFDIKPDFVLGSVLQEHCPYEILNKSITGIRDVIRNFKPDYLIVQGDTSTTFAGALAAYYEKINVLHLEAGIRRYDKSAPVPEELNSRLTSYIADFHFVPTEEARLSLIDRSVSADKIFMVGYTGVDALFFCLEKIENKKPSDFSALESINFDKKVILVTGNLNESFCNNIEDICCALKVVARKISVEVVYNIQFNPAAGRPAFKIIKNMSNMHLIDHLDYPSFVYLMSKSCLIITDSSDIQPEASSLKKPVLLIQDVKAKVDGVGEGTTEVIGAGHDAIIREVCKLIENPAEYERIARAIKSDGNGSACVKIRQVLSNIYENRVSNNRSSRLHNRANHYKSSG
jgi:UDP-N-acetylglucosamine 2-epimerase (non-hydrolysing)